MANSSCELAKAKLKQINTVISKKKSEISSHTEYYKKKIQDDTFTDIDKPKYKELLDKQTILNDMRKSSNYMKEQIKIGDEDFVRDIFENPDSALMSLIVNENKKITMKQTYETIEKELSKIISENESIKKINNEIKEHHKLSDGNILYNKDLETIQSKIEETTKIREESKLVKKNEDLGELNELADKVVGEYTPYKFFGFNKRIDNFGRTWRKAEELEAGGDLEAALNLKKFSYMYMKDVYGRSSNGIIQSMNIDEVLLDIQNTHHTKMEQTFLQELKKPELAELYPNVSSGAGVRVVHGEVNPHLNKIADKDMKEYFIKVESDPNYLPTAHETKLLDVFSKTNKLQADYFEILRNAEGLSKKVKKNSNYRNFEYDIKKIDNLSEDELRRIILKSYKEQAKIDIRNNLKITNVDKKKKIITENQMRELSSELAKQMKNASKNDIPFEINLTKEIEELKGKDISKEQIDARLSEIQKQYGPGVHKSRMNAYRLATEKVKVNGKDVDMSLSDLMIDDFMYHQMDNATQRLKKDYVKNHGSMSYKYKGEEKILNPTNGKSIEEFVNSISHASKKNSDGLIEDITDYMDDLFVAGFAEKKEFGKNFSQYSRIVRGMVTTSSMGSVLLTSFVEVGTSIASVGFVHFIQSVGETSEVFKRIKLNKATQSDLHFMDEIGYSLSHDYWSKKISSIDINDNAVGSFNPLNKKDKVENAVAYSSNLVVNRMNFLSVYTGHMRMTAGVGYIKELKKTINNIEGGFTNSRIQELGLNENQFNNIKDALNNSSSKYGVDILDDMKSYLSREDMDAFSNAIRRKANNIILDVSKGENNKWLSKSPAFKTMFQFHTYTTQATTKMLLNGYTHGDIEFIKGFLYSSFIATNIQYGKDVISGRTEGKDFTDYLKQGLSTSSFAGELPFFFSSAWDILGVNKYYDNPFLVRNRDMNIRGFSDLIKLIPAGGFSSKVSDFIQDVAGIASEGGSKEEVIKSFFRLWPDPLKLKSGFEHHILNDDK